MSAVLSVFKLSVQSVHELRPITTSTISPAPGISLVGRRQTATSAPFSCIRIGTYSSVLWNADAIAFFPVDGAPQILLYEPGERTIAGVTVTGLYSLDRARRPLRPPSVISMISGEYNGSFVSVRRVGRPFHCIRGPLARRCSPPVWRSPNLGAKWAR